ncbi:MAG: decarboxylating 6-phosphogluconate dehydrogenase [Planctomycetota bacterium]|nr:decarboxylating 6-phosphogluconate dehydrogenase [Planctomycetota bacterium]
MDKAAEEGAIPCYDSARMPQVLEGRKVVWIMVPAGKPVDDVVGQDLPGMKQGDIIINSRNSNFRDSKRRGNELAAKGIDYLDVGTSGGVWGLEVGYCLMIGGPKGAYQFAEPVFETLAPKEGYLYCGPSGSGHFVKMVHNGIEYGMLQAYAEGFEILEHSEYDLDFEAISHLWNQGSVVRSWLLELAESMFGEDPKLDDLKGYVNDSGEGRWTVIESITESVPAPVIALSLMMRFRSRQDDTFSGKVIAGLRNQFGGHAVKKDE